MEKEIKRKSQSFSTLKMLIIVFGIIGIVLIGSATGVYIYESRYERDGIKTYATITRIDVEVDLSSDSDYDYNYYTYVSYSVDGVNYNEIPLGTYFTGMKEGQEIQIYYMPDNPKDIMYANLRHLGAIAFASVGGALLLTAIIMITYIIISKSRINNLRDYGYSITAVITEIKDNPYVQVNGVNPMRLICTDNENNVYKSGNIYKNRHLYVVGHEIIVYTDQNNEKKYMIDIDQYVQDALKDNSEE